MKNQKKKSWFKRVSAVLMTVALVLSGISLPDGLFNITVKAATKASASWTVKDTMYADGDSDNSVTELSGKSGKLVNSSGDELLVDATAKGAKITNRVSNGDYQVNKGTTLTFPVVSGAKTCTITLKAYYAITADNIQCTGLSNIKVTEQSDTGWKNYVITGEPQKGVSSVSITITSDKGNYFKSMQVDSSTSYAETAAAFAKGHTKAEWDYTGSVSASNSKSSIQKVTGTYTNADGDVLYVDATPSGKFQPDATNTRIQVNTGTKIVMPANGDKAVITLLLNKNNVGTDTESVLSKYITISGKVLRKAECISNEKDTDGNYRKVTIECYLTGDEGEITLDVIANTYIKSLSIDCQTLDKKAISGTVTSNSEIPSDLQVVATNKTTGLTYTSDVKDGNYLVEVPAEDTEMEYELSLSNPAYIIASGVATHKISTSSSDITANLSIMKLSTCTVTGTITGFADDYDTDNLNLVFTTTDDTEYVPEVIIDKIKNTYSAKLEKGITYSVGLKGVNDYDITSTKTGISYSEDSTLNFEVSLKPVHKVSLTLPEEPDMTGKSVTYTYTNKEDGYTYIFANKDSVQLRDGSYTLSLSGDFEAQPYKITAGDTVTVKGADATQTLVFEQITKWSFVQSADGNYYKDNIQSKTGYYNGLYVDATKGKLVPNGASPNSAQFTTGAKITVPVSGKCTVSVTAYQAQYALYTINGTAASTTEATTVYNYDSKESGSIEIVSIGSAYIASISVVYPAKDVEYVEQKAMPKTYGYGSESGLVVQPTGQRLVMTQTGGAMPAKEETAFTSASFYGFEETSDANKLTADITINECGSSNSNGIFFGAFNKDYIVTAGIRKSNQLKMIYSKSSSELAGAASGIDSTIPAGTVVTFTMEKTDDGLIITVTPKDGETKTATYPYEKNELFKTNVKNTAVSYGFVLAGVKATIQNMKYTAADGTVLYDQNNCYKAEGTAPVVKEVTAKAASTRDYITVSWNNSVEADGDGVYVLQVSKDGSEWKDVETELTATTYKYAISDAGEYSFRVCGKLGVSGERNSYAEAKTVEVMAALDKPVVSIASSAKSVNLSWKGINKADTYEVYRYSYDETQDNASLITTTKECAYEDKDITTDMPYYYYVVAYSHIGDEVDNYSNPSETVWAVPSTNRIGKYVYEDQAGKYTVTKKSYDTVYNGKITIEGIVEDNVSVILAVNGNKAAQQDVKAKGKFAFTDIDVAEGRNDVELLFTDSKGNTTRETYNYVYLTNYNKVVDSAYEGADGEAVNGIPTYKTVQAAVDSVSSNNTDRVIILVKEGDYEEHLVVNSPYITLIGEDSEKTRIFYDTKEWVGGNMQTRCAVLINSAAKGFSAENLTIENTYKYLGDGSLSNESCDALRNDADETSYINVRILGYQDTLCANGGTQYYYKCYIAGNVDFIYGNDPRALFNDCRLIFRYNANKNSGYVCAPKASADAAYGLTFNNCQILSEDGCSGSKYYLARPWGADAYITWINCYMGKILSGTAKKPYSDMSGNKAENARFFEYGTYGPAYVINADRRQISKKKAEEMISADYLGWNPYTTVTEEGTAYKGSVKTESSDRYVEKEYLSDTYDKTEGNDSGLSQYGQEGYAQSADVTGGGLLKETSDNYYTAGTAEEFLKAIQSVKKSGKASVIELTADVALGDKEVNNFSDYSAFITAHKLAPLTHPTLLKTGVSMLKLADMSNLTIYSKNGAKITHTCVDITGSSNIIIRNIKFDELWEWDENTSGAYDRNDWDYMTIEKGSSDIWIDHCTFYKAYDGVIDVKTPNNNTDITISWCEFLPASDNNVFFEEMMNALKVSPDSYPYYKHLLEEGMTEQQIYNYCYGQKKTHLFGQSDEDTSAKNITVTLANNYYKNSMDRMPRLRYGTAHVYNCIMDAQDLRNMRLDIENTAGAQLAQKIVSNGASSNCGAHMLLENCYMSGISNALISGNGDSAAGYINAINTIYMLDGQQKETKVILNTTKAGEVALIQDKDEFKSALPYSGYTLYAASSLDKEVKPYTGAGKLTLTTLQWEKTTYNDVKEEHTTHVWNDGTITKEPTCTEAGEKTYTCTVCGESKKETVAAAGHKYSPEWTIDKEATTTENGSKSHHCTVCGDKADITVIPMIKEEIKPEIKVELVKKDDVPETSLSESKDDIINSVLTEDEIKAVKAGAKVDVSINVNNADKSVSAADKTLLEKKLNASEKIGTILNIEVNKVINGEKSDVHELNKALTFKFVIPENLINKNALIERTYGVIRIHNGVAENVNVIYNEKDNTITFATDRFSTYAIIYKDAEKETENIEKPSTGAEDITNKTDENITEVPTQSTADTSNSDAKTEDAGNSDVKTADSLYAAAMAWFMCMVILGFGIIYTMMRKNKKSN